MEKIILIIDNKENERLLRKELKDKYDLISGSNLEDINNFSYDMGIIDGLNLEKMKREILLKRYEEKPLFIPFLLITTKQDIGLATKYLWKVIDELITIPIVKAELQARVAVLLRARYYSFQIKSRFEEMEIFTHALGHDLQSPVRAIQYFSKTIKEKCSLYLKEECQEYCDHIVQLADRISDFNESLHNLLKIGNLDITSKKVSIKSVIEKVCKDLIIELKEKNASIEIENDIEFYIERNLLETIIRNLIQNAILYSKEGVPPEIKISSKKENSTIIIEIKDNGIGIPEKEFENIFKMFYRLHSVKTHKGSGLGLSIVKKCVELMKGKIWVKSILGEGSSFYIRLPYKTVIPR